MTTRHYCPTCGLAPVGTDTCACGLSQSDIARQAGYVEGTRYLQMLASVRDAGNYTWQGLTGMATHHASRIERGDADDYGHGRGQAWMDWLSRITSTASGNASIRDAVAIPTGYPLA